MKSIDAMLATHPQPSGLDRTLLVECLKACHDCAATCTSCADASLSEGQVQMLRRCIRLNLDCADICDATARVLVRQTEPDLAVLRAQVQACATACRSCGEECARHAHHHEHCRTCAESCRSCADACDRVLPGIAA